MWQGINEWEIGRLRSPLGSQAQVQRLFQPGAFSLGTFLDTGCSFYSRCGPWTSCISITWGIVGTIYSRAPPGTTETESVVAVCPG